MNTYAIMMTDAYAYQDLFNENSNIKKIDCRDVEGTKCYLDDLSKEILMERLSKVTANGIHFIDSGNYHYLSLLMLQKIDYSFNLILFDNHPDNQPPSFGNITSCGGWVLEASQTLPNLKNVYTYGVGLDPDISDIPTDIPVYISIDKDILSQEYAITDWDQGEWTLPSLLEFLTYFKSNNNIIGIDICGDSSEYALEASQLNNQTNQAIFDFFSANN